jgi:hypothetical protein
LDNPLRCEKVLNTKHWEKKAVKEAHGAKYSSYAPFVCSTGELVMQVFVVPFSAGKGASFPLLMQPQHPKRGSAPVFWAFTESGLVNTKLWMVIMKKFAKIWFATHPGLEPVVVTDNLNCHTNAEILEWCIKSHVHTFFLPAHSTQWSNPLDQEIFTEFKNVLRSMVKRGLSLLAAKKEGLTNSILCTAQKAVTALTSDGGHLIRVAFKKTGLVPFQAKIFLANAKLNIGEINEASSPSIIDQYTFAAVKRLTQALTEAHEDTVNIAARDLKDPHLFADVDIIDMKKKQREKKDAIIAAKAAKKERRAAKEEERTAMKEVAKQVCEECVCHGENHEEEDPPVFRGGKQWKRCHKCAQFFLCPKCTKTSLQLLVDHDEEKHGFSLFILIIYLFIYYFFFF